MVKRNQHLVPHPGRWSIRPAGSSRASSVHDTQQKAIDQAREVARSERPELIIHGRDGRIRARDSHGHDPHPPTG